jgi:hypothetical protein
VGFRSGIPRDLPLSFQPVLHSYFILNTIGYRGQRVALHVKHSLWMWWALLRCNRQATCRAGCMNKIKQELMEKFRLAKHRVEGGQDCASRK